VKLNLKNITMERFSMKEVIKNKFGESEKSTKTARSTKKANSKAAKVDGKYITKTVAGVKYMVLK
jgi:hypothetical protein